MDERRRLLFQILGMGALALFSGAGLTAAFKLVRWVMGQDAPDPMKLLSVQLIGTLLAFLIASLWIVASNPARIDRDEDGEKPVFLIWLALIAGVGAFITALMDNTEIRQGLQTQVILATCVLAGFALPLVLAKGLAGSDWFRDLYARLVSVLLVSACVATVLQHPAEVILHKTFDRIGASALVLAPSGIVMGSAFWATALLEPQRHRGAHYALPPASVWIGGWVATALALSALCGILLAAPHAPVEWSRPLLALLGVGLICPALLANGFLLRCEGRPIVAEPRAVILLGVLSVVAGLLWWFVAHLLYADNSRRVPLADAALIFAVVHALTIPATTVSVILGPRLLHWFSTKAWDYRNRD